MSVLNGLKPEKVFKYFEQISNIPRGSGNTRQISDYCVRFAKERNLSVVQDKLNNIIIKKPATAGREQDAGIIIQGHLDMVCEKTNESGHDFLKDGLELYVEGDWLKAKGTTLGGDDGIAVAVGLAILDSDDISHPDLNVIFTVDEETGMDGAKFLDMSQIEGKYMLNLDSEDEGIFVAGCAGGAKVKANFSYRTLVTEGRKYEIKVSGLRGGHSGMEIDKERGNADIIMARVLSDIMAKSYIEIISIDGGTKDNAIPRECVAQAVIRDEIIEEVKEIIKSYDSILKQEYAVTDEGISLTLTEKGPGSHIVILNEDIKNILFYLNNVPNGIMNMSKDIEGLVETSLNLGILTTDHGCVSAVSSVRSSVASRKQYIIDKINQMAEIAGGFTEIRGDYPAWRYNRNSKLMDIAIKTYEELTGNKAVVNVIHAGLECGYINEKRPDIDIVAFGPNILDIHTTEERMSISSVERFYNLVTELLKNIH